MPSQQITVTRPSLGAGPHELARLLKRVFEIDIEQCPSAVAP
ncbi:MAG: hypothetical protein ACREVY_09605 [Gammaproteobacteria bacterium]